MNVFEEVKNSLDIVQVVYKYGFKPNKSGFIYCPFHDERTPSLKLYTSTNSYYCFGCNASGDIISFVSALYREQPLQTVKRLISDFGLAISIDEQHTKRHTEQQARQPTQTDIYRYFEEWQVSAWRKINDYYKFLLRWGEMYKPTAEQPLPWQYAVVCEDLSLIRYLCELFLSGEYEYIYMNYRKEIDFYYGKYRYFRSFEK